MGRCRPMGRYVVLGGELAGATARADGWLVQVGPARPVLLRSIPRPLALRGNADIKNDVTATAGKTDALS